MNIRQGHRYRAKCERENLTEKRNKVSFLHMGKDSPNFGPFIFIIASKIANLYSTMMKKKIIFFFSV